jgi:ABC-type lipoprotein export system ATPase subunit
VSLARLSRNERAALRRRAIGYIFQDFNLPAADDRCRDALRQVQTGERLPP